MAFRSLSPKVFGVQNWRTFCFIKQIILNLIVVVGFSVQTFFDLFQMEISFDPNSKYVVVRFNSILRNKKHFLERNR